jgi:hypothetical protein
VAQLDDVHSVLRLNYETLRGLISLALAERCKTYPIWDRGSTQALPSNSPTRQEASSTI